MKQTILTDRPLPELQRTKRTQVRPFARFQSALERALSWIRLIAFSIDDACDGREKIEAANKFVNVLTMLKGMRHGA